MMDNNVALYLGMADDIWTPLLYESVTTIYAIDLFDNAYAPAAGSGKATIDHQRETIRRYITDGNNSVIFDMEPDSDYIPADLPYLGVIKRDRVTEDGAWRLDFQFGSRDMKLVVFSKNFMSEEWPAEITNVGHVFMIGSGAWTDFVPNPENTPQSTANFIRMMTERTKPLFPLTAALFLHEHFRTRQVWSDRYQGTQHVATNAVWRLPNGSICIDALLPPEYLRGEWGIDKYGDYVPANLLTDPDHNKKPCVRDIMALEKANCQICGKEVNPNHENTILTRVGDVYCSVNCAEDDN